MELVGSKAACLQSGQSHCNHNQERHVHPTFWLCTEYRLPLILPACDLRLGLTYITPQSSLQSVPFTDITLFRDGNILGEPFCSALLSVAPAYLGYDRYVHNHICVLACNDPLLNRCG